MLENNQLPFRRPASSASRSLVLLLVSCSVLVGCPPDPPVAEQPASRPADETPPLQTTTNESAHHPPTSTGEDPPLGEQDVEATLLIDGSSTVFPITEVVTRAFSRAAPRVKIRLGISGTGGGFKKFCRGETVISDASRPIKSAEAKLCREHGVDPIELPTASRLCLTPTIPGPTA